MWAAWMTRTRARVALVVGITGAAALLVPAAAGAQQVETYGGGTTKVTVPGDPGDPADPGDPGDDPASLPFTGGDVAGLALIGAGALGAGLVVSRVRRRAVA